MVLLATAIAVASALALASSTSAQSPRFGASGRNVRLAPRDVSTQQKQKQDAVASPAMALVELSPGASCAQSIEDALSAVKAAGCAERTRTDTSLFCGFSFSCGKGVVAADVVAGLKLSVVNQYPVTRRAAPASDQAQIRNDAAPLEAIHSLTGVNQARSKLGLTGKGVKIAILDSGVYYKHPALGGCFGAGCKVSFGYDLVDFSSDPIDNCSKGSRGTHIAGIIAGNALNITDSAFQPAFAWTGVAPGAQIGAYRIFGCFASDADFDFVSDDILTSALYRAAADGADIILVGEVSETSYPDSPDAAAVDRISAAGLLVVSSYGDHGSSGFMVGGNPGGASNAFGVVSFDNLDSAMPTMTVDGVEFPWVPDTVNGSFAQPTETLDIFVNDPNAIVNDVNNDGCTAIGSGAKGKTVLLRYSSVCGSRRQIRNAATVGAKSVLMYIPTDPLLPRSDAGRPATAYTTERAAAAIIASSSKNVVLTQKVQQFPVATAGTVSSFSSPGLDAELNIKPDIGAIGSPVYSCISPSYQQKSRTPYAAYSSSTAAAAYLAGTLALYLEAKGKSNFQAVRTAFQNTATPSMMYKSNFVDTVARQGAGLVNVYNAITTRTVISPPVLALNDTVNMKRTHYSITLTNKNSQDVTYNFSNVPAATVYMYNGLQEYIQPAVTTTYTADYATLVFGNKQQAVFTTLVKAGASLAVNIDITQPTVDQTRYPIYSGYIRVTNDVDDSVTNVPYAGMAGDWEQAAVVARTKSTSGFLDPDTFEPIPPSSDPWNLTEHSISVFPRVASKTRLLTVDAVYAGKNQTVKNQLNKLGIGHSSTVGYLASPTATCDDDGNCRDYFFSFYQEWSHATFSIGFDWNGDVNIKPLADSPTAIKLPAGDYTLRIRALRHFASTRHIGDSDFDSYEQTFTIVY